MSFRTNENWRGDDNSANTNVNKVRIKRNVKDRKIWIEVKSGCNCVASLSFSIYFYFSLSLSLSLSLSVSVYLSLSQNLSLFLFLCLFLGLKIDSVPRTKNLSEYPSICSSSPRAYYLIFGKKYLSVPTMLPEMPRHSYWRSEEVIDDMLRSIVRERLHN